MKQARTIGRRGRPSREGEREITLAILDAALQLFLTNGYGATSMKRIGEEAGVAPNTLYARFPEKATLFRAIVEWKTAVWKVTNPPRYAKPGSPISEVIEVAMNAMFEAMDREDVSAMGRLLAQETERFPELAQIYSETAARVGQEGLIESMRASSDCGLSEKELSDLANTMMECASGHMNRRMFNGNSGQESHRRAAKRIAKLLSYGAAQR
ncbi:TetR/AcrR family transcriptional regulator [Sphingobium tyrosinilyticum]|uniref:TetR/AcrR family transcriptional regulator n=1 Tax=Sphingobium tyrosinilyticum TaxID=2715436 RepID=A0ABV9EX73_9SPHN